jgi:hypothetical protein
MTAIGVIEAACRECKRCVVSDGGAFSYFVIVSSRQHASDFKRVLLKNAAGFSAAMTSPAGNTWQNAIKHKKCHYSGPTRSR